LKLLLLTSALPWPLEMHGGAQRTALLLEALRTVAEVDMAFVSWSEESVERARLARENGEQIVGTFHVPDSGGTPAGLLAKLPLLGKPFRTVHSHLDRYHVDGRFSNWLKGAVRDGGYDGVVSRYLWPGAVGGLMGLAGIPRLLDWDDLDHLKLRSQIEADPWKGIRGSIAKALVLSKLKNFCLSAAATYDHVWVAKPSDTDGFAAKSISVLPNIPYMEEGEPRSEQSGPRRDILFIGSQTYLPNSDALTKFLETAWPRIVASCPDARVLAIGPPPFPDVAARWLAIGGVEIVGAVPSLTPYYGNAALSVCPVEWGGGSNIKAIESLGYGVPCVVSPYTYGAFKEDFGAETGMICAPSEADYVRACVSLLSDPQRSGALGRAGQRVVRSRYSRSRFQEIVRSGLAHAGA
jgi:polysaccharide biosynthesis protein PslH